MNPCPPNVSSPFNCGTLAPTGSDFIPYLVLAALVILVGVGLMIVHWWQER